MGGASIACLGACGGVCPRMAAKAINSGAAGKFLSAAPKTRTPTHTET